MKTNLMKCPEHELLLAYKNGELGRRQIDDLTPHLVACDPCMLALELLPVDSVPELVTRGPSKPLESIPFEKFISDGGNLELGQVWSTKTEGIAFPTAETIERYSALELGGDPNTVVISNPRLEERLVLNRVFRVIRVVPISDHVEYALDGDRNISSEDSLFGYPIMLQNWNEQEMLTENLDSIIDGWNYEPEPVGPGSDFSFFSLISTGRYGDSKMRFRSREFESMASLRDPVASLRDAAQIKLEELARLRAFVVLALSLARRRVAHAAANDSTVINLEWSGRSVELHLIKVSGGLEVYSPEAELAGKKLIVSQIDGNMEFTDVFEPDPTEGMKVSAILRMSDDLTEEIANSLTIRVVEEVDESR